MDVASAEEAISASCSARRRDCWVWAKDWIGSGVDVVVDMVKGDLIN